MKINVIIIKNGEMKMRLPGATIRNNQTVWESNNQNPIINSEAEETKSFGLDKIKELITSRNSEKIPVGCLAKFGDNGNGLIIVDAQEYIIAERAKYEAALTPAQREKNEIDKMFAQADYIANSDREDNVMFPNILRCKAKKLLEAWKEKYPAEANREKAEELRQQAQHKRDLAVGALTYDADGWLSSDQQQQRHDDFITEAKSLEREANDLCK